VPRAILFDLVPGVIEDSRASPLGELFCSDKHVNQKGNNWAKAHCTKHEIF
jgi:tubulin beta